MPWEELNIIPGVDVEKTQADNASGISVSNFIRWRDKIPEKRGGWSKFYSGALSGTIRALHGWEDLNSTNRLAAGTTSQLAFIKSGAITDITAQYTNDTFAVANCMTTTLGSAVVTITDASHGMTSYDVVEFKTHMSSDGVVLHGQYNVTYVGTNTYTVTAGLAPNGTQYVGTAGATGGALATYTTSGAGDSTVTVTLNNHGYEVGNSYYVEVSTAVGGLTLFGIYTVLTVPTANTFTINAGNTASSGATVNEGGTTNVQVVRWTTLAPTTLGTTYGGGTYGSGLYGGTGTTSSTPGTPLTATDYWLANWGEILLSCPTGYGVFEWSPQSGLGNSKLIATAPEYNAGMFLAMPYQQVMCWGSSSYGAMDPLLIRWSDVGDYTVWEDTTTNQAGSYHLPTGSLIVRGLQATNQLYWWTDVDVYASQYVGTPYVWGFNKIASNCGLIAPKAVSVLGSAVYWMSQKRFYVMGVGSGVTPIPCSVWDFVFQNMNTAYVNNIRAATNDQFHEVTWFFPSAASTSGENDSYVCYNTLYNEWDYGSLGRSAWTGTSAAGGPFGALGSYIYEHEVSPDADGSAINASFTTGFFSLSNGSELVFVDKVLPDMKWGTYSGAQAASVKITFYVTDYMGQPVRTYGPYTVTQATDYIDVRFRGRFVQIKVESSDTGSFWRLGSIRYRFAVDGRR